MKIVKFIIISAACLLVSCAASLPYKSLSGPDIKGNLSAFPTQEDHPNATAVFLLNYGSMEMFDDGTQIYKHITRYKILNERGYYLAKKSISYREDYSRVKILYANTIKPDGTSVPLKEEDIIDSASYSQYEEYTDIKEKKFTMPAIEPGCIVEYAYEVKHSRPFLLHDYYTRFAIQEYFPVKENVMEIILPKGRELHIAYFKTDIKPTIEEYGD
ncbi:MAG: transglutaminase protein, partial [Deltaproteobacteria bacterium]|nr:transglutaminase protein [Deltaproteobacteria bacterium]